MPELSFPPWLLSALTGGLAGALLTQIVNWLKAKDDTRRAKRAQLNALRQELRHALWLIDYNYKRIVSEELPHKGLTVIEKSNVERILFSPVNSLPLPEDMKIRFEDYYQQISYHNSLVNERAALVVYSINDPKINARRERCEGEIRAICTPNDHYRENDPEPSLQARVKRLIQGLDELNL